MIKRSKVNKGRGSAVRGWKKQSPKRSERKSMITKCGSACFLDPKNLKYPICQKRSCKRSCKGIVAAKIRASQYKNSKVRQSADKLINRYKCTKKSRKNVNKKIYKTFS